MAEISYYRPMNPNASALEACLQSSTCWLEIQKPWEFGDATKSFTNAATTTIDRHDSTTTFAMDSWKTATKVVELHDAAFREPTSVLDLQTSSLSSQHSFNSVSDGTSTALQTVTDQLLSDEQDSAFLMETSAKPNNVLMDQDIQSWMDLMREPDQHPTILEAVPGYQEDPSKHIHRQMGISRHVVDGRKLYSCAGMDLDFDLGTMGSMSNTPASTHQGFAPQLVCEQALTMPTPARNQILSNNSSATSSLLCQRGYPMNDTNTQGNIALPSMFGSITSIPASQLQNYTAVPTVELLRLLSSQKHDPPPAPAPATPGPPGPPPVATAPRSGILRTNFPNDQAPSNEVANRRPGRTLQQSVQTMSTNFLRRTAMSGVPQDQENGNGLHLVHLLLACAEAIDLCESTIAEPMLARLRSISDPQGYPMQRIALYFTNALSDRLASEMASHSFRRSYTTTVQSSEPDHVAAAAASALECDIAYQAYYQILPFQKFTHFTANQALLEGVANYPRVHIVDFNIRQGLQWPSFMQSLAMHPNGPPELRITAVQTDAATARLTGNRLAEFARCLQVPFEFHIIEEDLETFQRGMICPRADEALAVNCSDILHRLLRKEGKLHSLLCKVRSLRPVVVTILEADANHNVPSFMSRFVHALHYYCALFDSLEATLHRTNIERLRIENLCFAAEIRSIVALEGVDREVRHVRASAWQAFFLQAGFQQLPVSRYATDQAQLLLSLYETSDTIPFRLLPEFGGLSLGWQETPVMAVSSWTC